MQPTPESPASYSKGIVPGEPGIWFFVGADLTVFSTFFLTYAYYFGKSAALFLESQQQLNIVFGTVNTMLLLTSSWFLVLGIAALKKGNGSRAKLWFLCTFALGACFVISKALEYTEKFKAGLSVRSNEFFMFYFMFTFIHLIHVLAGLALLAWVITRLKSGSGNEQEMKSSVTVVGIYWHVVDLLWILIFSLIYLAG